MSGATVMVIQWILFLIAIVWRGGSDKILIALGLSFMASIGIAEILDGMDRSAALGLLDAVIVAVASRAWINHHDLRGWWIGWLGLIKIGARLLYASDSGVSHLQFAAVVNIAFIAQVIIAGGMLDDLGRRIADHLRSAGPRRARLLRNVEGR